MGNLIIVPTTIVDGASVAAGNAVSTLPVSNLKDKQPWRVTRSSGLSDLSYVFDFGAVADIDTIYVGACNMSADGTWQVRMAESEAGLTASPSYNASGLARASGDSGGVIPSPKPSNGLSNETILFHRTPSVQSFRWMRIDVSDVTNPDGFFQAGRVIAGRAFQPKYNASFGLSWGFQEDTQVQVSIGGSIFAENRSQRRILSFALENLTGEEAYNDVYDINKLVKQSQDVLVCTNPDATSTLQKETIVGLLEAQTLSFSRVLRNAQQFTVTELT